MDGIKEVLGMWTSENKGVKFWLQVVTEQKSRGVTTGSGIFHYLLIRLRYIHPLAGD